MASAVDSLASPAPMLTYIARQAIYDRTRKVWGYELLHRAYGPAGSGARNVVITAGLDVGLAKVSGNHRVLVSFDAEALLANIPSTLPSAQLIIDVVPGLAREPLLVAALMRLAQLGYLIAVDGRTDTPEDPNLMRVASIVRLDAQALLRGDAVPLAERLRAQKKHLFATEVDTSEALARCRELNVELFQGPLLDDPEILSGRRVAPERTAALMLLAKINDPSTSFADLSGLIHRDAVLSYQLLRFIGSAAFARPVKVDSVQRALILMGLGPLRQWASLLLLSRAAAHDEHALTLAMTRARMAEILASRMSKNPSSAFTVGLFSGLEHLLGEPLADLLAELPLEHDVSRALLGGGGWLGDVLQTILMYEDGIASGHELNLTSAHVVSAYVDAVEWAELARSQMQAV